MNICMDWFKYAYIITLIPMNISTFTVSYHLCVSAPVVPPSPKFYSALLYDQPFASDRAFSDKTEWSQNDLDHYKIRFAPCMCYWCLLGPIFHPIFIQRPAVFKFWVICPIYVILVLLWVPVSLSFTLQPAVFELYTILRQVHQITFNYHNIKGQRCPIYVWLQWSLSRKFCLSCL